MRPFTRALYAFGGVALGVLLMLPSGIAADPFWGADPGWSLIHEPAVERELSISPAQNRQLRDLLDAFDARFLPLRNRPPEEAAEGVTETLTELTKRLESLLSKEQLQRLGEIRLRQQGTAALQGPVLTKLLDYTPQQKESLDRVISETLASVKELEQRAANGEPREPLEKQYAALKHGELERVTDVLTPVQRSAWKQALGRDLDLTQFGRPAYKAPELVDTGEWLNSEPLSLMALKGKVVVVHFYAFGCINCIRNYPTYLDWQKRYHDKGVVIIGIHTPETAAEQDSTNVRQRANEAAFTFPVLIDRTKANWNAWGNSMWPSVYLIDKRGYLRYFWPGELKWNGATGDQWMGARLDELLAEPERPSSVNERSRRPSGPQGNVR